MSFPQHYHRLTRGVIYYIQPFLRMIDAAVFHIVDDDNHENMLQRVLVANLPGITEVGYDSVHIPWDRIRRLATEYSNRIVGNMQRISGIIDTLETITSLTEQGQFARIVYTVNTVYSLLLGIVNMYSIIDRIPEDNDFIPLEFRNKYKTAVICLGYFNCNIQPLLNDMQPVDTTVNANTNNTNSNANTST